MAAVTTPSAEVHDADDQEDRDQPGTAVAAVEAEAQAVSPGRAGVGRQRAAAPGHLAAASEMTRLPRGELEDPGHHDHHTDRDRYGARQRGLLHLDRRQRDAQRKSGHSEYGPDEEVTHTHECVSRPRRVSPAAPTAWRSAAASDQDGSIIATIITTHMPERHRGAGPRLTGIRLHAIDCPTACSLSPTADMDAPNVVTAC